MEDPEEKPDQRAKHAVLPAGLVDRSDKATGNYLARNNSPLIGIDHAFGRRYRRRAGYAF